MLDKKKDGDNLENEQLVKLIRKGVDVQKNYEILFAKNKKFILYVIKQLGITTEYYADALQDGYFAIREAVTKFDFSAGAAFTTYLIKVLSTQYGCEDSDILTLEYTLPNVTVPIPSITSGEYKGIQQVELTAEDGANIYFTTDGTDPFENGELYTCPIILTTDTTLKAYAEINGCVSDICEYEYTISDVGDCNIDDIIVADEMIKVNITTNKNESGILIIACYDGEGRLLDVNYCDITLDANISNSRLIDINTTSATTVSAFLWNNCDSFVKVIT